MGDEVVNTAGCGLFWKAHHSSSLSPACWRAANAMDNILDERHARAYEGTLMRAFSIDRKIGKGGRTTAQN